VEQIIIKEIANYFEKEVPASLNSDNFRIWLAQIINDLIVNDFEKLLAVLYLIDIDEDKVKQKLSENENLQAGEIIADMIINRQEQKKYWREYFKNQNTENISEEEKW
jgi:hypothetical protein